MSAVSPEISVIIHLVLFTYAHLIVFLLWGWFNVRGQKPIVERSETSYSIVIPYRNEADTLPRLLSSLVRQNFSRGLQHILLVNDHSYDGSVDIIKEFSSELPLQMIDLGPQEKGKKEALKKAWTQIKTDYIVQLDADIELPENWAEKISGILGMADLYILPVQFEFKGFWQALFSLEFMTLSIATFGSTGLGKAILANGAHLIYKNEGLSVMASESSWQKTASGDDMNLLDHFRKHGKVKAFLLPSLKVSTPSVGSLRSLFNQRLRWAAKTNTNGTFISVFLGFFVIIVNAIFLISLFHIAFGYSCPIRVFHVFALSKILIDIFYLWPALAYFRKRSLILLYPILAIVYPFYVFLLFILSFKKTGNWKERQIKLN